MVCSAIWFSSLVGEIPNRSFSSFTSAVPDLLLKFDDVARRMLVLRPVCIEFSKKLRCPSSPLYVPVAFNESKNGKFLFLRSTVLSVGHGPPIHRRAVLDTYYEQIDLAAIE